MSDGRYKKEMREREREKNREVITERKNKEMRKEAEKWRREGEEKEN